MPPTAPSLVVETEELPGSQVGLTIEVPQETVDATYERVLNRLAQRARIEGFRPGKAPRPLVEARLGPAAIREEVIEALVPAVVGQALSDKSIEAIDRPRVEVLVFERGRPARLSARVSVMPTVTLPEFEKLHVEPRRTEVEEQMLEGRLARLREEQAEIEPVEREVRAGDIVIADLEVEVEGVAVESERRTAAELTVAEGELRPEILAVLPGTSIGQEVRADTVLPEEHRVPELRGRPASLRLTVRGVKEKRLPELTDELAAELSQGSQSTAEDFRESVRADLVESVQQLDRLANEQAVVKEVVDASQVEVPEAMVDLEVERELQNLASSLQRQGLRLERYFEYTQQSEEEWRAAARPEAAARVRAELVLDKVAEARSLQPSEAEVEASLREEAERDAEIAEKLPELLASRSARDFFRHRLQRRRVLEWLMETVAGVPATPAGGPSTVEREASK